MEEINEWIVEPERKEYLYIYCFSLQIYTKITELNLIF